MRYADERKMDISNGEGIGISLFVQGCHFHCKNCFNSNTWDFSGGKEWTKQKEYEFLKLADNPYIKRISILGGEPLADENLSGILPLVNKIRYLYGDTKTIWLYSGFYWEEIFEPSFTEQTEDWIRNYLQMCEIRKQIIAQCNVMIDGRFVEELKNLSLMWRGSSNQSVINVRESLAQNKIVLYCE